MHDYRFSPTLHQALVIAALCLLTACRGGSVVATSTGPGSRSVPMVSTTPTTQPHESDDESDHAEHTGELAPARSAELGLEGPGQVTP